MDPDGRARKQVFKKPACFMNNSGRGVRENAWSRTTASEHRTLSGTRRRGEGSLPACASASLISPSLPIPNARCKRKRQERGSFFGGWVAQKRSKTRVKRLSWGQLRSGTQLSPLPSLNNFDRHHSAWRGLESRRLIIKDGPHFPSQSMLNPTLCISLFSILLISTGKSNLSNIYSKI